MAKGLILTVIVRKEKENYISWCPELDVASYGATIEEAKKNLQEAVEVHIETIVENGDLNQLLEKLGISKEELNNEVILTESFSGQMNVPFAV